MPTDLKQRVIAALGTVYDPEIPVDIYQLGLVYEVDVSDQGDVRIAMTLTSPNCPVAEELPPEVEMTVSEVEGVRSVAVDIVWEPEWQPEMMSEAARLELGME